MFQVRILTLSILFAYAGADAMESADYLKRELSQNLLEASKTGTPIAVEELIRAQADVNYARPEDGLTPLMLAAMFIDREDVFRLLIKHGAKVAARNKIGRTALQIAAFNFQIELCDMIFEKTLKILDENQKQRVRAFLFCLKQKYATGYPNLKNIFKQEILTFIKEENRPKILAEIRRADDYVRLFQERYFPSIKKNNE